MTASFDGDVETSAFLLRLKAGTEAEYRRRHDALWPEMRAALLASGILHYEIYLHGPSRMLFAHMVRRVGSGPDAEAQAVMLRWRAYMADILEMNGDLPVRETLDRQFQLVATSP